MGRKKKAPTKGELQQNIANIIDNPELGALKEPFPHQFKMVKMDQGRVCAKVTEGRVLKHVSLRGDIQPAVANYLRRAPVGGPLAQMDRDGILGGVKYWADSADPITEVEPFLWANESPEKYTWHRLPFDREPHASEEAFPLWLEILNRIEEEGNRRAALLWIGSLFAKDSYRQQYLWLYGDGGDSKGAISRVLKRIFGGACKANLTPPGRGEDQERWCTKLVGIRLATFPDCNAAKFPGSGLFKQITGGDYLGGRLLFQEPIEFMPDCKVLFVTNKPPAIDDGAANARRAIICTLAPFVGEQRPDYEEELYRQAGAFCNYALTAYEAVCPNGVIPCDTATLSNFASVTFEEWEVLAEELIVEDAEWCIMPKDFLEKVQLKGLQRRDITAFREYLVHTKGFKKRSVRADEMVRFNLPRGAKIYPGFRLKTDKRQSLTMVVDFSSEDAKTRVDIDG